MLVRMGQRQPSARQAIARVGWENGSQTVTIPVGFRFARSISEVYIRRDGESVVLTPRPTSWASFFASELKASPDFMIDRQQMPPQER